MRSAAFGKIAAAFLLLALAACGGLRAAPAPPIADFSAYLLKLQTPFDPDTVVNCVAIPLAQQTPCRDKIVQALMIAIDLRYEEFELGFFDANRYASFAATLTVLGLNEAGAVIKGLSPVLNAAAAGVTGASEAYKKEVLIDQTSVALLNTMRSQRDKVSERIRLGLRLDATQYPLGAALADVSAYYRAGTLVGAVAGVSETAGVERQQAQENLRQMVLGRGFSMTPLSVRLRAYVSDPNVSEAVRKSRRQDAVAAARAEGVTKPLAVILSSDTRDAEDLRTRIAKRMGL